MAAPSPSTPDLPDRFATISADNYRALHGLDPVEPASNIAPEADLIRMSPRKPAASSKRPRTRADLTRPLIELLRRHILPDIDIESLRSATKTKPDGSVVARFRIGPEDDLSAEFRVALTAAKFEGRYRGTFCHVPNEAGGRSNSVAGRILRYVGLIPGAPDWWLLWTRPDGTMGGALIELKAKAVESAIQDTQKIWRAWCREDGVPHMVTDNVQDALDFLSGLGAFDWSPAYG